MLLLFNKAKWTRFDRLLNRKNTALRLRITLFDLSSRLKQKCTFTHPGDMPFNIDLSIWVCLLWYSVIRSWLLHIWTSAALSISHEAQRSLFVTKIFGFYAFQIKDFIAGIEGDEFLLWRFVFNFLDLIWRSKYFGYYEQSLRCFWRHFSIK